MSFLLRYGVLVYCLGVGVSSTWAHTSQTLTVAELLILEEKQQEFSAAAAVQAEHDRISEPVIWPVVHAVYGVKQRLQIDFSYQGKRFVLPVRYGQLLDGEHIPFSVLALQGACVRMQHHFSAQELNRCVRSKE